MMNVKFLCILYVFSINLQLSKQVNCETGDYFQSKTEEEIKEMLNEELCLSFSYQFGNSVCKFTNENKACESATEEEFSSNKYTLTNVSNNCGFNGFFEPLIRDNCTDIKLVEGHCCYVNYTLSAKDSTIRKSCLRTNKFKKKGEIPGDISELVTKINKDIKIITVDCKESNIKMKYNLLFAFLIFLI